MHTHTHAHTAMCPMWQVVLVEKHEAKYFNLLNHQDHILRKLQDNRLTPYFKLVSKDHYRLM